MKKYINVGVRIFMVIVIDCWIGSDLKAQDSNYMPYGIPFQGLLKDHNNDNILARNREIFVVASILDKEDRVLLKENFYKVFTNKEGVFSIVVGTGIQVEGLLQGISEIDWQAGPCYLQVSVAILPTVANGISDWDYTRALKDMGKAQIYAVPYAFTAGSVVASNIVGAKPLTSNDSLIKVANGDAALLKSVQLEIDTTNLKTFIANGVLSNAAKDLHRRFSKKIGKKLSTGDLPKQPISGDVTGTFGASVVEKINGAKLGDLSTAVDGQVLAYNGENSTWMPKTPKNGTITKISVDHLQPLFTAQVDAPSSTPEIKYRLTQQGANTLFAGPMDGSETEPSFRRLTINDLPNSNITTGKYHGLTVNEKGIIVAADKVEYQVPIIADIPNTVGVKQGFTLDTKGKLQLSPANAEHPGILTTDRQAIAGDKIFLKPPTFNEMSTGSILFAGRDGLLSQANHQLFWDYESSKLGIGTKKPNNTLEIKHGIGGNSGLRFTDLKNTDIAVEHDRVDNKYLSVNADGDVILAMGIGSDTSKLSISDINVQTISGDVTGTFGASVVEKINGTKLGDLSTAVDGQVLAYNGENSTWVPKTPKNGTLQGISVANLSTLFTTKVENPTTNPGITYKLNEQNSNFIFAGPANGQVSAAPTFRRLTMDDLPDSEVDQGNYHGLTINKKGIVTGVISIDYQVPLKLSTTGTGTATFDGKQLNIPTYVLPKATINSLGGVKIGSGLSITPEGVLSNSGVLSFSTGATGLTTHSGAAAGSIELDGILKIANGGTGLTESIQGGILYGVSDSKMAYTLAGTKGQLLQSNGSDAPTWVDATTSGWGLKGNSATDPERNFIGTTDDKDLVFKRNNIPAGILTTDNNTTAFGVGALEVMGSIGNSAFGRNALGRNGAGKDNVAMGYSSLEENTAGNRNVAIGNSSLQNSSGDNNTALGNGAGKFLTEGNFNIAIGSDVGFTNSDGSYQLNIGNAIYGKNVNNGYEENNAKIGINVPKPVSTLEIDGSVTNHKAYNAQLSLTIDFSKSNLVYTSRDASNNFILQGIKDGGTYTLAITGTRSGEPSFSAVGFTFKSITNMSTVEGKETLYNFVVMSDKVYSYMLSGF